MMNDVTFEKLFNSTLVFLFLNEDIDSLNLDPEDCNTVVDISFNEVKRSRILIIKYLYIFSCLEANIVADASSSLIKYTDIPRLPGPAFFFLEE